MIVTCKHCRSRLKVDENRLDPAIRRFSARCPRCRQSFFIDLPDILTPAVEPDDDLRIETPVIPNQTIVITNQKGGVAKTSTCLNLGLSLALQEKRVLLIDFDVQANLTISLGYQETISFYNLYNRPPQELEAALIQTSYPGLWLLPSSKNMVLLSKKFFGQREYEFLLDRHLQKLKERFDYILIDTPPSIEFFTINALTTANLAIIPTPCDYLATHGVEQVINIINLIRKKTNPTLNIRVLVTMYDESTTASRMIFSKLKTLYPTLLCRTVIPRDERLREAQIMSMPVINYDQKSTSGQQYLALAQELAKSETKV
jgi:chromosome partitioning protein